MPLGAAEAMGCAMDGFHALNLAFARCNLRGWPPVEQRALVQLVGVAIFIMVAPWLGGTGMVGPETAGLLLLELPALALGTWAEPPVFRSAKRRHLPPHGLVPAAALRGHLLLRLG